MPPLSMPAVAMPRQQSHKRRATADGRIRLALMEALAPVVSRLTTEQFWTRMGSDAGTASQRRHDLGDIEARRVAAVGLRRLLLIY
ncbi:hypothetical protein [Methylorubrum extorquens]|nr:hypothetical protein [Methylorubrum extorquens]